MYSKNVGEIDHKNGERIRHTLTMNGNGNTANIYVTVYGLIHKKLSRRECPFDVLHVRMKKLCYGGGKDCENEKEGFVVFIKS